MSASTAFNLLQRGTVQELMKWLSIRLAPVLRITMVIALLEVTGCTSKIVCHLSPSISGQPASQQVSAGSPAIFTVAASGSAPLKYQWLQNGQAIAGATNAAYVTSANSPENSNSKFEVSVSNLYGNLTSNPATLTVTQGPAGNVRFVAPTGSDANPGTLEQPFRTIQKCASSFGEGGTCQIRGGNYPETVTPNSGVTITAYNFETVTVNGSDPVLGWTPFRGSIYKANINLPADDSNQIFVGNQMMTEARWPNGNDLFNVNWSHAQSGTSDSRIVDSELPAVDWTGAKIHLWSGSDPFGNETGVVTASGNGSININPGQTGTCPYICPSEKGLYYLFGVLNALDSDQEWFYDPESSTLYFQAPGGIDPNTIDVRARKRQYAFDLRGKSNVTISNIGIFGSTIVTDSSSSKNTLNRIQAQYISHFTSLPTDPSDPSGAGYSILDVHLEDSGIVLNGTGNTLENSTISFSAGAGVAILGNGNAVFNNLIENVDYIGDYASGIELIGNGNTVRYNTVQKVGRQAIYVTGAINQDVGFNNLFNAMLLSRDGAEIYACCQQVASGTRIHNNWIHDTQTLVPGQGDEQPLSGIYIDNGSDGFSFDQNVLWQNQNFNFVINGFSNSGPNTNSVHNNTIPDNSSEANILLENVASCPSSSITQNLIVSSIQKSQSGGQCATNGNGPQAIGANEMQGSPEVGCNFSGCSTTGPPAILDSGYVTPCPVRTF